MTTSTADTNTVEPQADRPAAAPRGADLLVESLVAAGITTVFGVPGDTGVVFYDALHAATDRVTHVLMRDERHAAKAADAYARVSGRVGTVEVSSGGGTTFVVGGLGEAYAAGIPVLLITSDIHSSSHDTGALTEIDQEALFSAVTKWCGRPNSADEIPDLVAEAVRHATTGRPAPVALILPEDVLDEVVAEQVEVHHVEPVVPAHRKPASDELVQRAATVLRDARFPVVIAGSGVHSSTAYAELADLAEHLGAPVATTIHGRGVLPDTSPWAVGTVGNNGERPGTNDFVAQADVVLLVGTRANATDTSSWTIPSRASGTPVIQVDIDPARAGRNFPDALGLVGDARTVLRQLVEATPAADEQARRERRGAVAELGRTWRDRLGEVGAERARLTELPEDQLLPADLVRVLREALGSRTVVIADPGTPTPNTTVYWDLEEAGRTVIVPRGHGPMGYAIPAAVGAAYARPGEPVVSITADGSFAMACGELETVARFGLPVLYVQLTNNSMGWIKMLQHLYTGQRYFGVDPGPIDAPAVARACGLRGVTARTLEEFCEYVAAFAADPVPTYIDVQVPHMIDYQPPVPAWHPGEDGAHERPVY